MSTLPPPPPMPEPSPATPPKRNRTGLVIAAVAGGVLLLLCAIGGVGAAISLSSQSPARTAAAGPASASPTVDSPTPEAEPTTEAPTIPPKAADFTLTVKMLTKHCFGSAGCNLTFRVAVDYSGFPVPEDKEYTVAYVVTGGEDGPQQNTFTIRGTTITYDSTESLSTSSSRVVPTAHVVDVLPN